MPVLVKNKKVRFDYEILDTFEAGIELLGTEVKSLRLGNVNLKESFCRIKDGEVFINNMHISPYELGNRENHDPTRVRKLLLHRREIDKLTRKSDEKGLTLVPTKIYFKNSNVKLEIGIGKGKKHYDKRETLKRKQAEREVQKAIKDNLNR
jgi:SsrA-binding protein